MFDIPPMHSLWFPIFPANIKDTWLSIVNPILLLL